MYNDFINIIINIFSELYLIYTILIKLKKYINMVINYFVIIHEFMISIGSF